MGRSLEPEKDNARSLFRLAAGSERALNVSMDHTASPCDCHGQRLMDLGSEHRRTDDGVFRVPYVSAAAAERPSPLLESERNIVDQENKGQVSYVLKPHRCRSRFCTTCAVSRGLTLRSKLIEVVKAKYESIQMWTLTIDPGLFSSPQAAFEYVREKRCISEWVRSLRSRGLLLSGDYFCVIEWQSKTEMPHFHILLNAKFISWGLALEVWSRFRPAWAGPTDGTRPPFGTVLFSKGDFKSKDHAAKYACKYLLKKPEHGYPDWVMDSRREIKRYQTSKGFWKLADDETPTKTPTVENVDDGKPEEVGTETTIRERIAKCASACIVLRVEQSGTAAEPKERRSFLRRIEVPFQDALVLLKVPAAYTGPVELDVVQVLRLGTEGMRRQRLGERWEFE